MGPGVVLVMLVFCIVFLGVLWYIVFRGETVARLRVDADRVGFTKMRVRVKRHAGSGGRELPELSLQFGFGAAMSSHPLTAAEARQLADRLLEAVDYIRGQGPA